MKRVGMLSVIALSVAAVSCLAQQPTISLRPGDTLPEGFTRIVGLTELKDGRLLVADGREQRLVVADLRSGAAAPIGAHGAGPGEYTFVAAPLPFGNDSAYMIDVLARRIHLLVGDRISATLASDAPLVRASVARGVDVVGSLSRDRLLAISRPDLTGARRRGGGTDSLALSIVASSGAVDTIAMLKAPPNTYAPTTNIKGELTKVILRRPPYTVGEDAVTFADGWIALVRLEPYRVEWRRPDGSWLVGSRLETTRTRLGAREKALFFQENPTWARHGDELKGWPAYVPAIHSEFGVLPGPDGTVIVRRNRTADEPLPRYDFIDRSGRLIARVRVSARERIVAAGRSAIYTAVSDDDDVQRLVRHPWVPVGGAKLPKNDVVRRNQE